MSKKIFFLIVLYLSTSCLYERVEADSSIPAWFEEGVYARYRLSRASEITFVNESVYWFKPVNAFFRWDVVDFDGQVALLEVSFTFEQETTVEYPSVHAGEPLNLNLTTSVYVDVGSRDIWSLGDEFPGKTGFWLPPNPEEGDNFVLFGKHGNYLNGTVTDIGFTVKTPQGSQPVFDVEFKFQNGASLWSTYDLTTGLLLLGYQMRGMDAMFLALNISKVDPSLRLDSTNIDLGPPSFYTKFLRILQKIVLVGAFILVAVIVYKRKR